MRLRGFLLCLVVTVLLPACGSSDRGSTGSASPPTTSAPDPGDTCKGGETAPFTLDELLKGMRDAGYDMYVDPGCWNPEASWQITNTGIMVPELEPDDYQRARAREGSVDCRLYKSAISGKRVTKQHYEGDEDTLLEVLNVACAIRPDPAKEAEQIERLSDTLAQLAAPESP